MAGRKEESIVRRLSSAALMSLGLVGAARADVLPQPPELSPLQEKLRGIWMEQGCHNPPAVFHSTECEKRIVIFGDETVAVASSLVQDFRAAAGAISGTWSEVSFDGTAAVVEIPNDSKKKWEITFTGDGTFTVAPYTIYPQATFKKLGTQGDAP